MTAQSTTLLNGRVTLLQSPDGLRASMDSVLLAAAVSAKKNDVILDIGCGTGAVGLCVLERLSHLSLNLSGIDIQSGMIDIAKQNNTDVDYRVGDVADKHIFDREAFDHIVMNPPYYDDGERIQSPDGKREKAYTGELDTWISSATHWVKQGGSLTLIHRADKLDQILNCAGNRFGAIEIWPIYTKPSEPAKRVVVRMVRNRKTPLVIHQPIMMFDKNGAETEQSKSILREAIALNQLTK